MLIFPCCLSWSSVPEISAELRIEQQGEVVQQDDLIADVDPNLVVDFAVTELDVATGIDTEFTLDLDGSEGELTRVGAQMTLDAFGFVQVEGTFYLDKSIGQGYR